MRKNKIIPIEVKSSGYNTHKSLDVFTEKYSRRILKRYLVYTKDMSKDQDIFCVPVCMVPFLYSLMKQNRCAMVYKGLLYSDFILFHRIKTF